MARLLTGGPMAHLLLLLTMKNIRNSPVGRIICCLSKKGYNMENARQKKGNA
jgi:hypothetical protein